jgi:hypothetical protein
MKNKKIKLIKYLLYGLIIALSVRYVPTNTIVNNNDILIIAAIASMSFALIDMVSPSVVVK